MNVLQSALRRTTPMAARRFASAPAALPKAPIPEVYQYSVKKAFLSDPGCYPIIAIMGFISAVVLGFGTSQMKNLKDLRIAPSAKHQILQNWGEEHHDSVTSRLAAGPMVMHGDDNRSTWREGLGVDHEEWLKQKAAQEAARY